MPKISNKKNAIKEVKLFTVESVYREDGTVVNLFTVNSAINAGGDSLYRKEMESLANRMADLTARQINYRIDEISKEKGTDV